MLKIKPYFRVPYGFLEDVCRHSLADADMKVYLWCIRHIQRNGLVAAQLTCAEVARQTGISRSAATRSLKKLVSVHMLKLMPGCEHSVNGRMYAIPTNYLQMPRGKERWMK